MRRVSAVIVTFNNAAMLKALLDDLHGQSRVPDEIIVVDNASADGTRDLVTGSFPGVRYLQLPENTGSAGGYHEGIKAALPRSDLIWTLDDDVRLEGNTLEELLKGFVRLSQSVRLSSVRSVGQLEPGRSPYRLKIFPWRGTLIRTDLIRRYGLPIKEFFIYGEDLEYAMRFNANGFHCYWIPQSKCVELRQEGKDDYRVLGRTTRIYSSPFQLYYAFRNALFIFTKYRDYYELTRFLLYAGKSFLLITLFDKHSALKRTSAIINGLLDGLRKRLGKHPRYVPRL